MTLYSPGGLNLADVTAPLILAYDDSGTKDVVFAVSAGGNLTITPDGGGVILAAALAVANLLTATGGVKFGTTVTLSEGAAHRLDLADGDSLYVVNGGVGIGTVNTSPGTLVVAGNVGIGQVNGASALEITEASDNVFTAILTNTHATPNGVRLDYSAATPNSTGAVFLRCEDATAIRADIRSNGGLANFQSNNFDLSDERLKQKYGLLGSTWDAHGTIEIWNFKYLENLDSRMMVGVLAQQVGEVAPALFSEYGWGDGEHHGVHSKDLTMYTARTVQECQARIESLEAEVASLGAAA